MRSAKLNLENTKNQIEGTKRNLKVVTEQFKGTEKILK